jgi:hypothetical protein
MPASFPCLNPTCSQVFQQDQIRGKASLTCPRCGTVFQFRAESPPTPPPPTRSAPPPPKKPRTPIPPAPAVPLATPVKAAVGVVPLARPVAPPPPLPTNDNVLDFTSLKNPAKPVAAPAIPAPAPASENDLDFTKPSAWGAAPAPTTGKSAPELNFDGRPTSLVSDTIARRARGSWTRFSVVMSLIVVASGLAVWGAVKGYSWLAKRAADSAEPKLPVDYQADVINYPPSDSDWVPDENARRGLSVAIARRRSKPRNHLAIHYQDYKTELPSEAVMIDIALTRLRKYFDPVEWERKPDSPDWKLSGIKGIALEFAGFYREDQTQMTGEVVMTASEGIGYWFFTWGPESQRDDIAPQWPVLRSKLTITRSREGWQETPRPTDTLPIADTPYELRYVKQVWQKSQNEPKDWDPAAIAVLIGTDPNPKEGKAHVSKQANARVLRLPKVEGELKEAATAGKDYVLKQQKLEYETTKDPVAQKNKAGSVVDGPRATGDVPGWLTKWKVINDEESRSRYMVLWIARLDDGVIVLQCDCAWDRRDFWEQEFLTLIESFRRKK